MAVRGHERLRDAPSGAERLLNELVSGKMAQVVGDLLRGRVGIAVGHRDLKSSAANDRHR